MSTPDTVICALNMILIGALAGGLMCSLKPGSWQREGGRERQGESWRERESDRQADLLLVMERMQSSLSGVGW